MKPQKEISFGVTLLFLAQNLFFPHGVQAQSTGTQTAGTIASTVATQLPAMFGQSPNSPNFNGVVGNAQQQLNLCLSKSLLGLNNDPATAAKGAVNSVDKWKGILTSKEGKKTTTSGSGCSATCTKPDAGLYPAEPNCSKFVTMNEVEGSRGYEGKSGYEKVKTKILNEVGAYITCMEGKKDCPDPKQLELEKQISDYSCYATYLQSSVQESAGILQTSLQANQKVFADMSQHQKEVGDQVKEMDEVLGPDPELGASGSSQLQGLLGLQKELDSKLPEMEKAEAKFVDDIKKIKEDTQANEQNLESTRVNVASQCFKGSRNINTAGGYSLTCMKPVQTAGKDGSMVNVTDRNGNVRYKQQSCGPYDYIRSKIQASAFVTSRGVMFTSDRQAVADKNSVAFDALADKINLIMGDYDQKGAGNASLDSDVHSWSEIEAKISGNIESVDGSTGVDVRSMLRSIGANCFKEADGWKNKQIRSSSSEYSKKKSEIKSFQKNLTSEMDNGITALNKNYSNIMAVLSKQHVSLDRTACTKDNPDAMQSCYKSMHQSVKDLVEGTGSSTLTGFTFKGGTNPGISPQPFSVPCRGLAGCVTNLVEMRKIKKASIVEVQNKKTAYATASNKGADDQLKYLANNLSGIQNTMLAAFGKIRDNLRSMGVDAPDKPNTLEGEKMEMMGKEGEIGPYKNPKSISAIISGNMEGGLLNSADTGMREPLKALAEKKKEASAKISEEIKEMKQMQGKYASLEEVCSIVPGTGGGSGESSSTRVSSSMSDCKQLESQLNTCKSRTTTTSKDLEISKKQKEKNDLEAKNTTLNAKTTKTNSEIEEIRQNEAAIAILVSEINSLNESKNSIAANQTSLDEIINSLQTYMDRSKYDDYSDELRSDRYKLDNLEDPNIAACKNSKEQIQACSDHLKSVYTAEESRRSGGTSSMGK